jgi:hypothetical protein
VTALANGVRGQGSHKGVVVADEGLHPLRTTGGISRIERLAQGLPGV